jgi:ribosomal peptide maturation radical SAM protein 1
MTDNPREKAGCVQLSPSLSPDFTIVVPPFASINRPSLGASIIAGIARDAGVSATVSYGNLAFAALVGTEVYEALCHAPTGLLLGERIFAPAKFGGPPESTTGDDLDRVGQILREICGDDRHDPLGWLQRQATAWADSWAEMLSTTSCPIIGFTTVFEQTLAALAIADRLKRLAPDKLILLGGANVDGEMADGIATIAGSVDHIFSGESEGSFSKFLHDHLSGRPALGRKIIRGHPIDNLQDMAPPDYSDYFDQLAMTVDSGQGSPVLPPHDVWLPYESSRGCWWGEKHHCTFCGLNAEGIGFRAKHPTTVLHDITAMSRRYGRTRIMMTDNIMPYQYFASLVPALASVEPALSIFYEQKANLSYQKMAMLADGGITSIQPGIESLSNGLLRHMRKGVSVRGNIDCLRFARSLGVNVAWNMLVDFPHDDPAWYESTLALVPLLHHLQPPSGCSPLSIDRFSPYFDDAAAFGIAHLAPIPAYHAIYGPGEHVERLAYHFHGEYPSTPRSHPQLMTDLETAVKAWRDLWHGDRQLPILHVFGLDEDRFLMVDTRPAAVVEAQLLDREHAAFCLTGRAESIEIRQWGLDCGYVADVDGALLPLAVANRAQFHSLTDVTPPTERSRAGTGSRRVEPVAPEG